MSQNSAASRITQFPLKQQVEYGLKVNEIGVDQHVISVRCQFCVHNGREEVIGLKRQRQSTSNVKSWHQPFRVELYKKHYNTQHPIAWAEYKLLSFDSKTTYFANQFPIKDILHSHFGQKKTPMQFHFNAPIVETIIGDMICSFILMITTELVKSEH